MKKLIILILVSSLLILSISGQALEPLQGGENVASAFVLSGPLPVISTGSTYGFADDYDEECPGSGSAAPDVVYSFSPGSDMIVDMDLCGSSYDTKIYVYENTVTPGIPYDCNDDHYMDTICGIYVSKIESIFLAGGNTYFIVIDGYDGSSYGDYMLTITDNSPPPPCSWGADIICPAGADEEEEICGTDCNGGCDMAPGSENWHMVPDSGLVVCGTLWAEGGNRDADWFSLTLAESSLVILTADADQVIQYGLISGGTAGYGGNPDCATVTGISPGNNAGPCNETILDLGLLPEGAYWFSASMTVDTGYPCNNHYWLDFFVIPQPCPAPVDLAATGITSGTALLSWTESGTATEWEYQSGPSGFMPAASGTATLLNPQPIAGLDAGTDYDFYIRSSCGAVYSAWQGPLSFSTLCSAVAELPWAEGFESSWPPPCWTDAEAADHGWSRSAYGAAHSGSEWAYCNLAGSILTTPDINLAEPAVLEFWFRIEEADFPQSFTVMIGNTIIYQVDSAINEVYKPVQVSLANFAGQIISVSFLSESGYGGLDFGLCLDDVSVKEFNTWTGNNNSDWNNISNWSKGTIPTSSDALLIPSVPAGGNFPVISGGISAECDHITISAGASLIVADGNMLDIKNP